MGDHVHAEAPCSLYTHIMVTEFAVHDDTFLNCTYRYSFGTVLMKAGRPKYRRLGVWRRRSHMNWPDQGSVTKAWSQGVTSECDILVTVTKRDRA